MPVCECGVYVNICEHVTACAGVTVKSVYVGVWTLWYLNVLACVAMNVHVTVVFEWCGCREFVHQFLDSSSHQNSPIDSGHSQEDGVGVDWKSIALAGSPAQPGIGQSD